MLSPCQLAYAIKLTNERKKKRRKRFLKALGKDHAVYFLDEEHLKKYKKRIKKRQWRVRK